MYEKMIHILVAEDSLEGILSAIAVAYKSRYGHAFTKIQMKNETRNMELFSEYSTIPTNIKEAEKVYQAIYQKIGWEALELVENVSISSDPMRADIIYRFLILGFANGRKAIDYLANDSILQIHEISRYVKRESNHWKEFLRFKIWGICGKEEKESAVWAIKDGREEFMIAIIEPQSKVLFSIMHHYVDRYKNENFIIYDKTHDMAGIHTRDAKWIIQNDISQSHTELLQIIEDTTAEEKQIQEWWNLFLKATDIPERYNEKLQKNFLPLWMRKNMTEFKKD